MCGRQIERALGLLMLMVSISVSALENGVGRTPAMGWNSWNRFNVHINETLIRQQADALISTGLAAKGYIYVNLDDGWHNWDHGRINGTMMNVDQRKFPSGMKALGDYLHSRGLKFGIYGDSGERMCGEAFQSGSFGHEIDDANLFASWGVDYLKYDNCYIVGENTAASTKSRFGAMRDALLATGRPIYFSICNWNQFGPAHWPGSSFGNSWRTVGDIVANFSSVLNCAKQNDQYAQQAGPGGWNDPDMLEVGNGMTIAEDRTHFSLWAIMKSPLLIGTDVATMSDEILDILGNEDVIAVNQDPLGQQGSMKHHGSTTQTWTGRLGGGKFGDASVALLFNSASTPGGVTLSWHQLEISEHIKLYAKNLWTGEVTGPHKKKLYATVDPHDVAMFVFTRNESLFLPPPTPPTPVSTPPLQSPTEPPTGAPTEPPTTSPSVAPASGIADKPPRPMRSNYTTEDGFDITLTSRWTTVHQGFRIQYLFKVKFQNSPDDDVCPPQPYSATSVVTHLGPTPCSNILPIIGYPSATFKKVPNWDASSIFLHFPESPRILNDCSSILTFNVISQSAPRLAAIRVGFKRTADSNGEAKDFWVRFHGYVTSC